MVETTVELSKQRIVDFVLNADPGDRLKLDPSGGEGRRNKYVKAARTRIYRFVKKTGIDLVAWREGNTLTVEYCGISDRDHLKRNAKFHNDRLTMYQKVLIDDE